MITNFKIFEDYFKDMPELSNKYKDLFYLPDCFGRDWNDEDHYILLTTGISYKSPPKGNGKYWLNGNCFTVMKNGKIESPAGWGHDYTLEELETMELLTAQQFYNKHPKLVEKLYLKIIEDSKKQMADWYEKSLKHYDKILSQVKELEYVKQTIKYNL